MPIKLIEPRPGKTPYYAGRGKHLGVYVDRSTKACTAAKARRVIEKWERDIERGLFSKKGELTFAGAALAYMRADGDPRPVGPLLEHFQEMHAALIDQAAIDDCAAKLFPMSSPATRNREVYTPVSAILKFNGIDFRIRRPKGSRGNRRTAWLWPEQAFVVLEAARNLDREFGIFCEMLLYSGLRLSELLRLRCEDVKLQEAYALVRTSKNGEPQTIHLTPLMVAALGGHPHGIDRPDDRVFRFHKGGNLDYLLLASCAMASGLPKPARWKHGPRPPKPVHALDWVTFHVFRHTYGSWMRRYAGVDDIGLIATGRWKNRESVAVYAHAIVSEEARRADLLPTPKRA